MKQVKAAEVARVEQVSPVSGDQLAALTPLPGTQPQSGPRGVTKALSPDIDAGLVAALEGKFQEANDAAANASFTLRVTESAAEHLTGELLQGVKWKGLEAYALTKAAEDLRGIVSKAARIASSDGPDELEFTIKHDLLEVIFHFVRNYEGVGYEGAKKLTQVAEVLVKPVNELNELRQRLRSAALEWEAAKNGMTPDQFVAKMQEAQKHSNN